MWDSPEVLTLDEDPLAAARTASRSSSGTTQTVAPQQPTMPWDAFFNRNKQPLVSTQLPTDSGQSPVSAPTAPTPPAAPDTPMQSWDPWAGYTPWQTNTTPPAATTAPVTAGTVGAPTIQSMFSDALKKLLGGPSPQDAGNDVYKSPAVTAYNTSIKRNEARDRQMLAERASEGGYNASGGMEAGILALRNRANEAMGRFAGEQAQQSEAGRRSELMQSLALALQFGDNEAARALQEKLGMGSLDVQRLGIGTSRDTALDQLGYNYASLNDNRNADLLRLIFESIPRA